ncbi:NAD-dependent epimerase/dehydratase family protein [Microbacterium sp. Mu-80]|uniref:NAD-dependent epimerase/dehydratase family protein n=1 Tax=Microbacterium bandirmense TaxID=3122050 RepID=A0ABU8LG57_9MICO
MSLTTVVAADLDLIAESSLDWTQLSGKTVAVTGASGMLGSYIVLGLLRASDKHDLALRVVVFARSASKLRAVLGEAAERADVDIVIQDVAIPIDGAPEADYVIHAASQASPKYFSSDPVGTIKANTVGVFNTLDYAVRSNAQRYVLVSTREVYGQPVEGDATSFTEDDWGRVNPLDLRSAYPEGKRAGETIAVAYQAQHGIDVRIARLAHTYGPGMDITDGRVQAAFLTDVLEDRDIELQSQGLLTRTYTYVADAASAMITLLVEGDEIAYNVADDDALVSIRELADLFNEVDGRTGHSVKISDDAAPAKGWSKVSAGVVDSSRLRGIGWRSRTTLRDGVERWVRHARELRE